MAVSELDRWRVAQQLITAHGDKAEYQAGVRAAEFVKTGGLDGFRLWQDIALKIKKLQQTSLRDPS
jgi:hypothetical protein